MDRWQDWLTDTAKPLTLADQDRPGRPTCLLPAQKSVVDWVKTGIYRTRQIAERIRQNWAKILSLTSLWRLFRANKLSYKRIRKSC
jgi:transposase